MSNRFLSNFIVLVLFGLGFFCVTTVINLIASAETAVEHEFSFIRRTADKQFDEKNWVDATRYYRQLAQSDPENCGAQVSYAFCLTQQLNPVFGKIKKELSRDDPDQSKILDEKAKIEETLAEAYVAYGRTLEFPQFRNFARFGLAKMHGLFGENELALQYLQEAVNDGFQPQSKRPLAKYFEFRGLVDFPEFRAIDTYSR